MGLRSGLAAAALALAVSGGGAALAREGDAARACRSGPLPARLAGCTALLAEARTPRQRAIALDGRCWANNDNGAFAMALADCEVSLRADTTYHWGHHNLGLALAGLGRHPEAIAAFSRALSLRPGLVFALLGRAKSRAQTGDRRGAAEDYDEVLRLQPANTEAAAGRASLASEAPRPAAPPATGGRSLCGPAGCS